MDGGMWVQRPALPPPPCQTDEVEHWSQAMFRDNNETPAAGPSRRGSAPSQAPVLARPASAPGWVQGEGRRAVGGRVSIRNVARTFHSTRAEGVGPVSASVYDQGGGSALLLSGQSGRRLYNTGEEQQ